MPKDHFIAINSPWSAEELMLSIEALQSRIVDYEAWCLPNEGKGLNLYPPGYFDGLKRALRVLELLLESHVESEHYGDFTDGKEPADQN